MTAVGPLAQSAERGAVNAKIVSSTLTRTTDHLKENRKSSTWIINTGFPAWTSLKFPCTFEPVFSAWTEHWASLNLFIYSNFGHNFGMTNVLRRNFSSDGRAPT